MRNQKYEQRPGDGQQGDGMGLGGFCICPDCEHREPHERGVPCYKIECPKCGTVLVREGA